MPYLKERIQEYTKKYCFDFIIGSSHMVDGKDPCFDSFYSGRGEKKLMQNILIQFCEM
ncbi:MAG: hypothetical protein LBI80_00920 [Endomicrobium sp.]|jgi:histidinol-phosphatase (PHP family)|nr:hypothetical protein [Endomicrobium sp.]